LEVGIAHTVLDCFLGKLLQINCFILLIVNPIELGVASQLKANKIDRVTFQNLAAIRLSYQKKVKAMKSTKRGSHGASEHLTFLALSRALHHFATSLICWSKFTNLLRVVTLASFLV
jgi:hypothetical protein